MALSAPIAIAALVLAAPGHALDSVEAPRPDFPGSGVNVIEHLGDTVPLDVPLADQDGRDVTLGQLLDRGDMPTILTFNYSNCPNLCSLQLNGLVAALPDLPWRVGKQFRILTIVLDPSETPDRVKQTRDRYTGRLPAGSDPAGWTFATTRTLGDATPIQTIAQAVGFQTVFMKDTAEWAHPAALIFLSARGRVIRYVHGVDYAKDVMIESINKAGTDDPVAAVGYLMRCFHWDASANDYSRFGSSLLRYAAAGFLALVLAVYGAFHLVRRHRARPLGDRP